MISGSEEESSITLPSPPTSSPNEFKSSGAFGIYLRSLPPSSPSDSRNFSDEAETLLPPLEVSHMTSVPANVLYLTCLPLYSDLYIKLHHLQHISSLAHNLLPYYNKKCMQMSERLFQAFLATTSINKTDWLLFKRQFHPFYTIHKKWSVCFG